jgi:tetratricopeptide (TPR) repeat protein
MPPHATVSAKKTKPKTSKQPKAQAPSSGWSLDNSIVCAIALVMICVFAYASSLDGKLVFDDLQIVMQNPQLMNIHSAADLISLGAGFRQLLFFTYGLNYYLGGLNTFGYHVTNVFLHTVNVLLIYGIILAVLRDDPGRRFAALAGAAVFAVHTLFSSAVSYIAGRSSVLCGTFYFAAILLFFRGLDSTRRGIRVAYFAAAGAAGLLAWQAKQEAITLPVFLAAILLLRMEKKDWRWVAPLALIPVVAIVLIRDQLKSLYAAVGGNRVLVSAGFENVLRPAAYFRTYLTSVVGYYFPRFLVPVGLSADPYIAPVGHWYSPEFLFSIGMLSGLAWLAVRFHKRAPLFSFGVTALLISPLMAYAAIPLADVVLEHRAYIPGLGVAFLAAWAFQWIANNYSNLRWAALGLLVVVFGLMTNLRSAVFANNIALWEDAEAKAPQKPRPHFNLGQAYQDGHRLPEAIREYEHALAIKPDIYAAYSNIAAIYLDQKQLDKGEEMLLKVTSLAPDFTEGFINLGVLYIRKQQPDKSLAALHRALEINPESFAAHFNRGEALTQKGDFKGAVESYREAVHLRPDLDSFRLTLGVAYNRAGNRADAEKTFNELTQSSVSAEAYRNLGVLYSDAGQIDQAMQYLKQAATINPASPDMHQDMGVLYLRKQMPNEAIEQFRTALQQQPGHEAATINLAAAYQMKGDLPAAKQTLQRFLQQFGNSNSPFVETVRQRLRALP